MKNRRPRAAAASVGVGVGWEALIGTLQVQIEGPLTRKTALLSCVKLHVVMAL